MHINARDVHLIRVEITRANQLFDFGNGDLARLGHGGREIARGPPEYKISKGISLPGFDDGVVGVQRMFHQVRLAVELPDLFSDRYLGAVACRREKGGNAHTRHLDPRSQRSLRVQFHLQLPAQQLSFELFVLSHIGADHPPDLPRLQQKTQTEIVDSRIIGDTGQVFYAGAGECGNAILGDPA